MTTRARFFSREIAMTETDTKPLFAVVDGSNYLYRPTTVFRF